MTPTIVTFPRADTAFAAFVRSTLAGLDPARLVRNFDDLFNVQQGDVLVTTATGEEGGCGGGDSHGRAGEAPQSTADSVLTASGARCP